MLSGIMLSGIILTVMSGHRQIIYIFLSYFISLRCSINILTKFLRPLISLFFCC
jgi:hypothetical protein